MCLWSFKIKDVMCFGSNSLSFHLKHLFGFSHVYHILATSTTNFSLSLHEQKKKKQQQKKKQKNSNSVPIGVLMNGIHK